MRPAAAVAALAVAALAAACTGDAATPAERRAGPAAEVGRPVTTSTAPAPATTEPATTTTTTAPPCPPVAGVAADVTVFRERPGGPCVPPGRLLAYRCTSRSAPAVVTDLAGAAVDHLGGRFATTVDAAPADAGVVAVRDDGARLLQAPSDAAAMFLDTGVAVTRWPALPLWTTGSGAVVRGFHRPAAFVVGDSVMLGAAAAVPAAMAPWDVVVDAAVSRSTLGGLEVVRARRGEIHDVAVVQLGTNDGADTGLFEQRVRAVMDELAGVAHVVWVTTSEARPYYAASNEVVRRVVGSYPNGTVADWARVAPPGAVYADGLHLRPAGAAAMAALVRDTVLGWYAALADRGPDDCRAALVAAVRSG